MHVDPHEVVAVVVAVEEIVVNVIIVEGLAIQVVNVGVVVAVVEGIVVVVQGEDRDLVHAQELLNEDAVEGQEHDHDLVADLGTGQDATDHIQMIERDLKKGVPNQRRNLQRSGHARPHLKDGPGKGLLMIMLKKKGLGPAHAVEQGLVQDHVMMKMGQTRRNQTNRVITELPSCKIIEMTVVALPVRVFVFNFDFVFLAINSIIYVYWFNQEISRYFKSPTY